MNLEAIFQRVPVAFCTVLIKREFMPTAALALEESAVSMASLAAIVFMSPREAENFVLNLARQGIVTGQHLGVADMMHGPLVDCVGIEYVWEQDAFPPSWTAFRVPSGSPD